MLCSTEAPFTKNKDALLTLHGQRWLCSVSKAPFTIEKEGHDGRTGMLAYVAEPVLAMQRNPALYNMFYQK